MADKYNQQINIYIPTSKDSNPNINEKVAKKISFTFLQVKIQTVQLNAMNIIGREFTFLQVKIQTYSHVLTFQC